MDNIKKARKYLSNLGLFGAIYYKAQNIRQRILGNSVPFKLISRHTKYPVICRPATSDIWCFDQVFLNRAYACTENILDVKYIIDCGANVGYTSAFLLSKYPNAVLTALEPDPENFKILLKNVEQFQGRVKIMNQAIWSKRVGLKFDKSTMGMCNEMARRLVECLEGETHEIQALDLCSVLDESGYQKISILKIDIEGAEIEVFSGNVDQWINRVDNIVIELHNDRSRDIFFNVVTSKDFSISQHGELTFCQRKKFSN